MNRRDFLKGLFGTAAVAAIGVSAELEEAFTQDWQAALMPIWMDYYNNVLIYGVGAITYTNAFPYIRSIPPQEIYLIPELHRSTGDF